MMLPRYLSMERLALRAIIAGDAANASSWFPGPFPVSSERVGEWLTEQHRMSPWDEPAHLWLAIVRRSHVDISPVDEMAGSVRLGMPRARTSTIAVHLDPAHEPEVADQIQAEVIGLVVPRMRDELRTMVVSLGTASDQPRRIAAAGGLGMIRAARIREHIARAGHRLDLLWYQALAPAAQVPDRPPHDVRDRLEQS